MSELRKFLAIIALGLFAIVGNSLIAVPAPSPNETKKPEASPALTIPFNLGRPISLAVQSAGVEWRGNTYHLVGLGSIQFELDKQTSHLKADIKAGITGFDNVDYDVSVAVFDAAGKLLGAARSRCDVRTMWAGTVAIGAETISMDFGVSLDYAQAATFMVSISNRKVLTPEQWPKK
jgi:hypothetical protein